MKKANFVTSASCYEECPPARLPEVALVGRSNVGKSSLINDLLQVKGLAKTSSTPGKTRLLNFFSVEDKFYLVDLPGYGYAKGDTSSWEEMIGRYLKERPTLRLILLLIDSRRGLREEDEEMIAWMFHHGFTPCLIYTKIDKLSPSELAALDKRFIPYSIKQPNARKQLLKVIHENIT